MAAQPTLAQSKMAVPDRLRAIVRLHLELLVFVCRAMTNGAAGCIMRCSDARPIGVASALFITLSQCEEVL
jgi:hypothetical protein